MTHFLKDILRQPEELQRAILLLAGANRAGRGALDAAAEAIRGARHVYLTGIGSSWHAALNVGAMFHQHGHPVYLLDADELLRFAAFPKDSAMIIISRSGKSTEIVQLERSARRHRRAHQVRSRHFREHVYNARAGDRNAGEFGGW
ncbi:MAG: hypothetical protein DMG40_17255 [Acidobacteria bacterium]|nr:MAG: hypothetical protein DMG40_17255 [Acidobacteriota bacterium]